MYKSRYYTQSMLECKHENEVLFETHQQKLGCAGAFFTCIVIIFDVTIAFSELLTFTPQKALVVNFLLPKFQSLTLKFNGATCFLVYKNVHIFEAARGTNLSHVRHC